jgi:hypothetical protein
LFLKLLNRGGSVTFTAPLDNSFMGFVVPDLTDDHHGLIPETFVLRIGNFSLDVFSNEMIDFSQLLDGFFTRGPGLTSFELDSFSGFPDDTLAIGLLFNVDPTGGTIEADVTAVPEPGSFGILACGLALLVLGASSTESQARLSVCTRRVLIKERMRLLCFVCAQSCLALHSPPAERTEVWKKGAHRDLSERYRFV